MVCTYPRIFILPNANTRIQGNPHSFWSVVASFELLWVQTLDLRCAIRFFLKRIIPVRAPVAEKEPKGAEKVGRDEEDAPTFVLADVDPLMRAGGVEGILRAGQDGMAEGDGGCSADERGAAEEPGGKAAVEFDDSLHQLPAPAGEQGEGSPEQAEERPG